MLISLTVGKVDAGVAVLLTEDKRLIEFPSILLPPSIASGSIVDITVSRNLQSEAKIASAFSRLQSQIYDTYGTNSPSAPILRCRNATQTSVVLEWDPISLATSSLRSLYLYRNGSKAGAIPRPKEMTSTKISGLAIDTPYTFHLVLKTSAGTYASEKLTVKTHKMTDLSGITVTPGFLPAPLRASLSTAVERIGGKIVETVRIDTTHFVCTEGRGREWERAVEMNIPVVRPEWVEGCERAGRIEGVRGYYLNADPRLRNVGQGVGLNPSRQQQPQPTNRRTDSGNGSTSQLPFGQQESSSGESQAVYRPAPGMTGGAGGNAQGKSPVPPTPPEKDEPEGGLGGNGNGDVTPRTAKELGLSHDADEEDESGDDSIEERSDVARASNTTARSASQAGPTRNLVGQTEVASPPGDDDDDDEEDANGGHRLGVGEARKGKGLDRTESDGGSFSEVQL
ncbi:Chitin synthase, class 5 [Agyrium rufum]|nr:Chitin synthase, class 5 [Agyrium rufum]